MHFTYIEPKDDLKQGDILKRTPEIEGILKEVHPHYFDKKDNKYFIVLTQSCDLVRGRDHDPCKSRYISIAPVRPIEYLLNRKFEESKDNKISAPFPICSSGNRNKLSQFLARLFNNNEPPFFYIHGESTKGLIGNHCAFLRLSIAVKSSEHYEKCLNARVISLEDSFQAKLGWLVGQMYSRVGTRDWDKSEIKALVDDNLSEQAFWVDNKEIKKLSKAVSGWQNSNPGVDIDIAVIVGLISSFKSKKDEILDRVSDVLKDAKEIKQLLDDGHITDSKFEMLRKRLANDAVLTGLLK